MVGLGYGDHVLAAGGRHRQPQRQIVGLRAGVHQEHRVQRVGQGRGQAIGEFHDGAVVEPGVGVQPAPLPGDGVGQLRVSVTQDRDVVDHVEVAAAVGTDQMLAPAAFDAGRAEVVVLLNRGHRAQAPSLQCGAVLAGRHRDGQAEQRGGVADPAQPAGRVVGADEIRNPMCRLGVPAALDPHPSAHHRHFGAGRHVRTVGSGHLERAAHLDGARGAGESQRGRVAVAGRRYRGRPRCCHRHRARRPERDAGGDGGRLLGTQWRRTGEAPLAEHRDRRRRTGLDRVPGQSILAVGVQPGAGVHRFGFRGQVESHDAAGVQVGQQCGAGNRVRRAEQAEAVPDHRGHDRRGHPGGLFEDAPLGLQGLIDVGVAGVDRGLLIAADHQHRRPHHN